jgi:hypothetical protein
VRLETLFPLIHLLSSALHSIEADRDSQKARAEALAVGLEEAKNKLSDIPHLQGQVARLGNG